MEGKDSTDGEEKGGIQFGRRSYLALAGTVATGLAGCTGRESSFEPVMTEAVEVFGYGGVALVAREAVTVSSAGSVDPLSSATEAEPNDSRANATKISFGTETTAELTAGDADWFAFDVGAGDELALHLSRESGDGIVGAILYDSEGSFLNMVYAGSATPGAVTANADTSGTYFAEIVDINGGTGAYTVTVTNGETPTATPTPTPTPTPTSDDYGQQGYGELGYGGI